MDMNDKDKVELEKGNEEPLSYHPSGVSPNWRYEIPNFVSSSIGLVSSGNSMAVCGDAVGPSCSSGSMVDSFGPTIWEHPVNLAPVGFNEMNLHNGAGVSDPLSMIKSGLFLQGMPGILPSSLSQFATDSAFIERAARFSSFSGGHFGDMLNPLGAHQSGSPYVRGGPMMQGPHEVLSGNLVRHRNSEASLAETSMDVSLPLEHGSVEDNSPKNETAVERSHDEAKRGVSTSGNDSDEPEFSGGIAQEEGGSLTAKTMGPKKRKRGNQDSETEQANGTCEQIGEDRKNNSEIQQRGEQNSTPTGNKSNGKNAKQNQNQNPKPPQASDSLKEEYIHVRARRGQATNSHSLAERIRREKISERMKFLQDLVPGCSKVTGKAVMLDEIINYVQSLQRQVEFLSMKLATVNPRLDFNIERLLVKDQMYSTQAGPSTGITFSPDIPMPYPPLNPSQSPILPPGLSGSGNSSDTLRRVISSQSPNMGGGYKDSTLQLPNVWDEELQNVVQMGFNASAPLDNQETNDSVAPGKMKAES